MRIMVLEDNPELGKLIIDTLEMEGHTAVLGNDGTEGLRLLEQYGAFDVIVTDMRMISMDGPEFINHVRADRRWMHIPCVLVTGTISNRGLLESCKADAFLDKPFHYKDLHSLLERFHQH